ncbi:hypothetical protein GPECTOR_46g240 [Gonium pectorale]|uniref:Protein kinase domain-containing protein n=1 Tax=Gonium pectorale TaxID=33097 RepID=A0A150G8N3_GONPE|nr:hypothetical protein GPECTOR_46g240 [Gonium pectorale]|eukprot:KXZ46171.1 hypothetical protein GPECTOR_46g240 [Gonium pectorale]
MRWSSCLFRPTRVVQSSLEVNPSACPSELHEQLELRGTACLRPRGATVLYERVDDAGQGAFTPPVLIYIKRLSLSSGLEVCVKRTLVTHFVGRAAREARLQVQLQHPHLLPALASVRGRHHYYLVLPAAAGDLWAEVEALREQGRGYSEDELRGIARQMLLGLEHLHAGQLAHRGAALQPPEGGQRPRGWRLRKFSHDGALAGSDPDRRQLHPDPGKEPRAHSHPLQSHGSPQPQPHGGAWSQHLPQWLRSAAHPAAQHPKRGGRLTFRVFVGAGAENPGGIGSSTATTSS